MKMIRRFFIYVFTVFTVLVLTYSYVYWGNLFGQGTPIAYLLNMPEQEEVFSQVEQGTVDDESTPIDTTEPEVTEIDSNTAEPEPEPEVAEIDSNTAVKSESIPPSASIVLTQAQPATEKVIVSKLDEAAIESQLPAQLTISIGDLWKQARDSFNYRDYETSVESYKQLIARTQDNFDAFEELGDVYNYYGKKKEAAAAYYGAATILVRLGRIDHAADFMKPLTLTDTVKAKSLLDLIKKAKKTTK